MIGASGREQGQIVGGGGVGVEGWEAVLACLCIDRGREELNVKNADPGLHRISIKYSGTCLRRGRPCWFSATQVQGWGWLLG